MSEDLKQKVVRSIVRIGGANAFSQAVTWSLTILTARILRPEDYGVMSLAGMYIGLAEALNEFGIGSAVVQKKELAEHEVRGIYTASLIIGLCFAALTWILTPYLAAFFKTPQLLGVVNVLSATFVISAFRNVQQNLMIRDMKFTAIAKIEVTARISTAVVALLMALAGCGVWTLVGSFILYNLVQSVLYCYCRRNRPGTLKHVKQALPLLHFGAKVMTGRIIHYFSGRCDSFIVGKIIGAEFLGAYSFSQTLAVMPIDKIVSFMNQVLFPVFSQAQEDNETIKRYFLRTLEIECMLIFPLFGCLALGADHLVPLLLGEKWTQAVLPLKIFAFLGIFQYLRSFGTMYLTSVGKPQVQIYFNAAVFVVLSASMTTLGMAYGLNGILASWLVFYPVLTIYYFRYVSRMAGIGGAEIYDRVGKIVLALAAMCATMYAFDAATEAERWLKLPALMLVGLAAYLASLTLLDRPKVLDFMRVMKLARGSYTR